MSSCRSCGSPLDGALIIANLGSMPLANALLTQDQLNQPEIHYPLCAVICQECLLVQLPSRPDSQTLFPAQYPFRSGLSASWVRHCNEFGINMRHKLDLNSTSRVLELGSNDGSGLRSFQLATIPVLGIDPCQEVADEAMRAGIPTYAIEWNLQSADMLSSWGYSADLVIARNVLAHVDNLREFLGGIEHILKPNGRAVFEVPYVGNMVRDGRWDQIYHEHYCYFGARSLCDALSRAGLRAYDIQMNSMHGGSLTVYACLMDSSIKTQDSVDRIITNEQALGLHYIETYLRVLSGALIRDRIHACGYMRAWENKTVIGYGASAKAITFINYTGLKVDCIVDTTPTKWDKYTPGSHIPIVETTTIYPDIVVNFCWNWREESERNIRNIWPAANIIYVGQEA